MFVVSDLTSTFPSHLHFPHYCFHPPSFFPPFVYHRTLTGIVSNIVDFTRFPPIARYVFDTNRLDGVLADWEEATGISLESSLGHKTLPSPAPIFYSPQEHINRS